MSLHFQYLPRPNLPGVINADMEEYVGNHNGQQFGAEEDLDRFRKVKVSFIPNMILIIYIKYLTLSVYGIAFRYFIPFHIYNIKKQIYCHDPWVFFHVVLVSHNEVMFA
jgi:hypothetical protein